MLKRNWKTYSPLWNILDLASGQLSSVLAQTLKFFTGLNISQVENLNLIIYTETINPNQCGSDCGFQTFRMRGIEKPSQQLIYSMCLPKNPGALTPPSGSGGPLDSSAQQTASFPSSFLECRSKVRTGNSLEVCGSFLHLRYRNLWAVFWISQKNAVHLSVYLRSFLVSSAVCSHVGVRILVDRSTLPSTIPHSLLYHQLPQLPRHFKKVCNCIKGVSCCFQIQSCKWEGRREGQDVIAAFTFSGANALKAVRGFFEVETFIVVNNSHLLLRLQLHKHFLLCKPRQKSNIPIVYIMAIDLDFNDSMSNIIAFWAC